jgi:hypothetical protein
MMPRLTHLSSECNASTSRNTLEIYGVPFDFHARQRVAYSRAHDRAAVIHDNCHIELSKIDKAAKCGESTFRDTLAASEFELREALERCEEPKAAVLHALAPGEGQPLQRCERRKGPKA